MSLAGIDLTSGSMGFRLSEELVSFEIIRDTHAPRRGC